MSIRLGQGKLYVAMRMCKAKKHGRTFGSCRTSCWVSSGASLQA